MAEKAIYEKTDKRRDYIPFLEQILNVCVAFKEKLDSGYERIFFREKGSANDWFGTQGEGWGNFLSCCVYKAIESGTKSLEISKSKDSEECETISIKADFKIDECKMVHENNIELYETRINTILEELRNGFIDDRVISRLNRESSEFLAIRRQLFQKKSVFYLKKNEIENYLEAYYNFLTSCVIYYDTFDDRETRDILIDTLLHLDSDFDEKRDNYKISFWAPITLNKLQKVNYGVELFFKQITKEKVAESKMMQNIYRRTLLTKAQHSFRWYISGRNHELQHAAIAPYVEEIPKSLAFNVATSNPKEYSSFEGIGELRLGEKILYEYGLLKEKNLKKLERFSIAILGDLHLEPLEELHRYVTKKIFEKHKDSLWIQFNIFTKNNIPSDFHSDHINYCGSSGEVLLKRKELCGVIDANNVVFILDCVELYKCPTVLEREDIEFIKQKYAFSKYSDVLFKNIDICEYNALEELYEVITSKQCFGQFGRVAKVANESLLKFCERKQKEIGKDSAIYIYVSDLQAFDNIYNDDQYYIRTERYNQKEIGIIRYSSEDVTQLQSDKSDKMLVFNMWQFIKNVAIDEKNMFGLEDNTFEDSYMVLDKIHIGLDYAGWPDTLVVNYYCEDDQYVKMTMKFIDDVLLPILNNSSQDMFNIYIRKAMYSFFYGAAKSVDDMLFIHLFQDKENLLRKVVSAVNNDKEKVRININKNFKYSIKRFYNMIMQNYDISSDCYIGQMKTSQVIQKNALKNNNINKKVIYNNVIDACNNLSYGNGYLVENCKRELL